MANMQTNTIYGDKKAIAKIFKKGFIKAKEGYADFDLSKFFDGEMGVRWGFDAVMNGGFALNPDDYYITFETKWSNPLEALHHICKLYGVRAIADYEDNTWCEIDADGIGEWVADDTEEFEENGII